MARYSYPAVFTPEENGQFSVNFPDLESCYTCGDDMKDALIMAEDVLAFTLYDYERTGKEIPQPSIAANIELEKNNLLVANFSIPFCNKDYFNEFWNKISNSILQERILRWELFWIKRFLGKDKRANGIFIKRTSIGII